MEEDKMLAFFAPNSVKKANCPYRADKECVDVRIYEAGLCLRCLSGKIADNTGLLITAIGNLTASIEERLCREEQK